MNKTFSATGVSPVFFLRKNEEASFTFTPSTGEGTTFDGRVFLERSDDGGLSWSLEASVTAAGYIKNIGKDANYRFRCDYSIAQLAEASPTLTGTATVATTDVIEKVQVFTNSNGVEVAKITEEGLEAKVLKQDGVQVATTTGAQTLTNKTLTSPSISSPVQTGQSNIQGGAAAPVSVLNLGSNSTIGTHVKVIEEVVSLAENDAKYKAMTTPIPAGAVILSVQANIEATVTGGSTTVKIGLGPNGGDVDAYGLSGDLVKNTKINTIPAWAVLATETAIDVNGVVTNGSALGDTNITAGSVRVRVVYLQLVSLANA